MPHSTETSKEAVFKFLGLQSSPAGYLPAAYYAAAANPGLSAAGLGAHYAASAVPTSVSGQTAQAADSRLQ